jgi:aminocarboxymuconate-semialdehyde decarboxylase
MKESTPMSPRPGTARRAFLKLGLGMAGALAAPGLGTSRAQTPTRQTRTSRTRSIDMHNHWSPESYNKAFAAATGQLPDEAANPLYFDLEKRLAWMDQHGAQLHVLTMSGRMPWHLVSPEVGAELASIVNDAAVAAHTAHPDRFLGAVEMSIRDPQLALKELNRVAGKPGIRAVHLPNSIGGEDYLFAPAYEPLLARCEELGYPLLFHPLDGETNFYGGKDRLGGRWGSAMLSNTVGFPAEHATTAAKFIVSGTLDKFPRLEVVLPHSGGAFPFIAGRIEHALVARKFPLPRPFREYLRRFHYDTLAFWPETLQYLVKLVGSDRVVIGTDIYYPMDEERPNTFIEQIELTAQDRDRILGGNAERLLHL